MANEIKVLDGDGNPLYYNVARTGATGDSFLPIPADLYVEIKKGIVPKYSIVHKYGRNQTVPNGSWEGVLQASAQFNFLTAHSTVRVKAGGHANDTAVGVGAQAVTVEGIDSTGAFATESIELAGASASSATSTSFWRVFRAYITPLRVGTYGGANADDIMIENSGGGTDLIVILAGEGQTQYASYSIPTGSTGYLLRVGMTSESSKASDFRIYTRANLTDFTTPFAPKLLKHYYSGIAGGYDDKGVAPILTLPALTDIWVEAQGAGAIASVSCDLEILIIED
jgi:hypothetical protein